MNNRTEQIKKYISIRYNNWYDYSAHCCRVHHLQGWESDLLNETILNILEKDETKVFELLSRKTKKKVSGINTTELDKFVLKIMEINASSKTAPFRKNVIGEKIIAREAGTVQTVLTVELKNIDSENEDYTDFHHKQLEKLHVRNIKELEKAGYSSDAINLYISYYINKTKLSTNQMRALEQITHFLIF